MSKKVLVLEASSPSALAIVRSLGRLPDVEVIAGDSSWFTTAGLSKYCSGRLMYPDPTRHPEAFIERIKSIVAQGNFDLLLPNGDKTTAPVAKNKDELEKYTKVACPDYHIYERSYDKALTFDIANQAKVPYPKTYQINYMADLERIAEQLKYPVVIKPQSKVSWGASKGVTNKITEQNYAQNYQDLLSKYKKVNVLSTWPLIQEYIPGSGYGFFALMNKEGKALAKFAHKRIREYPLSGGASTLRESFSDSRLEELGMRLLKTMEWEGVAMVEFKKDDRDGAYSLMEVNGRWWGSLPLALHAGVDFPKLYYQYLLGDELKPQIDYPLGVRSRILIPNDILWLAASLKKQHRWTALKEFFKFNNTHYDILSFGDPMPTLGILYTSLRYLVQVFRKRMNISGEIKN